MKVSERHPQSLIIESVKSQLSEPDHMATILGALLARQCRKAYLRAALSEIGLDADKVSIIGDKAMLSAITAIQNAAMQMLVVLFVNGVP